MLWLRQRYVNIHSPGAAHKSIYHCLPSGGCLGWRFHRAGMRDVHRVSAAAWQLRRGGDRGPARSRDGRGELPPDRGRLVPALDPAVPRPRDDAGAAYRIHAPARPARYHGAAQHELAGFSEVFVVSNATKDGKPIGLKRAGEGFHTDGEDKAHPERRLVPLRDRGSAERGDTLFVDMYAVHDALPEDVKRRLEARCSRFKLSRSSPCSLSAASAAHRGAEARPPGRLSPLASPASPHRPDFPLYRSLGPRGYRRPARGGVGQQLIAWLQEFARQERFIYRQQWRAGDAVLWDNRCTQHCATGFDDKKYVRTMYRTTLEGEVPVMAAPVRSQAA